jgi:DNA processing protein
LLSNGGITVCSGLAAGIDTAAHQGGLRGVGSTVAVVGTGLDIVYPARNKKLAHQIAEHGCLLSEYALATPAIAGNFPRRNRIISGLSKGVLVVEAAAQSGSLITARVALEQGREVFAIPGSIHSPLAKGCHQLIKQGAKLVESAQDIFDELPSLMQIKLQDRKGHALEANEDSDNILTIIGYDPIHIDSLLLKVNCPMSELSARLLQLELAGVLESLPGGMVQRLG